MILIKIKITFLNLKKQTRQKIENNMSDIKKECRGLRYWQEHNRHQFLHSLKTASSGAREAFAINLIKCNDYEALDVSVEMGLDVDTIACDENGMTALMHAAKAYSKKTDGIPSVFEYLLNNEEFVKAQIGKCDKNGWTVLTHTIRAYHKFTKAEKSNLDLLMENQDFVKTEIDKRDKYGRTALMHASYASSKKTNRMHSVFRDLMKHKELFKSQIDVQDSDGETVLMRAVVSRKLNIANMLIDAGADLSILDWTGRSVVNHLLESDGSLKMLKKLYSHGATLGSISLRFARYGHLMCYLSTQEDFELDGDDEQHIFYKSSIFRWKKSFPFPPEPVYEGKVVPKTCFE